MNIDPRRTLKVSIYDSADSVHRPFFDSPSTMPSLIKRYQEIREIEDAESPLSSSDEHESVDCRIAAWNPASYGKGADTLCLNDPAFTDRLNRFATLRTVRADEAMLDGPPLTACECARCREGKGKRSWGEYRRTLMAKTLKARFIDPARATNPNAILTFALPSDFDTARGRGLDVVALSQLFDRFFLRTSPLDMRVPLAKSLPSETILNFRWLAELMGKKAWGILPDRDRSADSSSREAALADAILMGAREIVFALDETTDPAEMLDESERLLSGSRSELASAARRTPIRGIAAYRPANEAPTRSPDSVFSLIDQGFPLRPTPRFPSSSKVALFDCRSLADRDLSDKLSDYLKQGGIACLSTALLDALKASGWKDSDSPSLRVWSDESISENGGVDEKREGLRGELLEPFGVRFAGSPGIALHLFGYADAVAFNRRESPGEFALSFTGKSLRLAATNDAALEDGIGEDGDAWRLNPSRWALFRV